MQYPFTSDCSNPDQFTVRTAQRPDFHTSSVFPLSRWLTEDTITKAEGADLKVQLQRISYSLVCLFIRQVWHFMIHPGPLTLMPEMPSGTPTFPVGKCGRTSWISIVKSVFRWMLKRQTQRIIWKALFFV